MSRLAFLHRFFFLTRRLPTARCEARLALPARSVLSRGREHRVPLAAVIVQPDLRHTIIVLLVSLLFAVSLAVPLTPHPPSDLGHPLQRERARNHKAPAAGQTWGVVSSAPPDPR